MSDDQENINVDIGQSNNNNDIQNGQLDSSLLAAGEASVNGIENAAGPSSPRPGQSTATNVDHDPHQASQFPPPSFIYPSGVVNGEIEGFPTMKQQAESEPTLESTEPQRKETATADSASDVAMDGKANEQSAPVAAPDAYPSLNEQEALQARLARAQQALTATAQNQQAQQFAQSQQDSSSFSRPEPEAQAPPSSSSSTTELLTKEEVQQILGQWASKRLGETSVADAAHDAVARAGLKTKEEAVSKINDFRRALETSSAQAANGDRPGNNVDASSSAPPQAEEAVQQVANSTTESDPTAVPSEPPVPETQPQPTEATGFPDAANPALPSESTSAAPPPPSVPSQPSTPAPLVTSVEPKSATAPSAPPSASTPAPSGAAPSSTPGPTRPSPAQVSHNDQKRHFIASLATFYKMAKTPAPVEIFNSDNMGCVKVGGVWVEMLDLFMHVMKAGGISQAMKKFNNESPFWKSFISSKGIPDPFPEPVIIPLGQWMEVDKDNPAKSTDATQYLIGLYYKYLFGFEQHTTRQRNAAIQQRQNQGAAGAGPANKASTSGITPAPATPTNATAPTPGSEAFNAVAPPTPVGAQLPAPSPSTAGPSSVPAVPISTPSPALNQAPPAQTATPVRPPAPAPAMSSQPNRPPPIQVSGTPVSSASTPKSATGDGSAKKRKKRKDKPQSSSATSTPTTAYPATLSEPPRPPTPKRARYKVEYNPLHFPPPTLAGWDARAIVSTFPKYNLGHPNRSIHELKVIDMEAVLMGLRSRIPRELGYSLTVLLMLSLAYPEERITGLPLAQLSEIFVELLELVSDLTFGDEGYTAWSKRHPNTDSAGSNGFSGFSGLDELNGSDFDNLTFPELERLGRDLDWGIGESDASDYAKPRHREQTGGDTDIILSALNLLRNLSMLKENGAIMATELRFSILLSRIIDPRLARSAGDYTSSKPFSLVEMARIRRDVVVILTNIGHHVNLRLLPFESTTTLFRLLSSFLTCGFETLNGRESPYGPPVATLAERPPPMVLSINNALEAFCTISGSDQNREVLSRIPQAELVNLFQGLIKLFPLTKRADEAMHTNEESLGYIECLSLSLYSLTFLSPLSTRKAMRSVPGAVGVIKRYIFDSISRKPDDFKQNPFSVLTRRLCEVLGVLNGTVSPNGEVSGRMGFSAGSGDGKGWRWSSGVVDKGWMAGDEESIVNGLCVKNMDAHAFNELDGLWWGD